MLVGHTATEGAKSAWVGRIKQQNNLGRLEPNFFLNVVEDSLARVCHK